MALTAAEQAEMAQLQGEVGRLSEPGLSAQEQAEMQQLQKEVGHLDQPTVQKSSWLDTQLPFGTSPRGFIQGALNTAPMVGTAAGGMIGMGAGGPLGAVGGAGIGAAGGAAVKNLGEGLLGQNKTRLQIYGDPVKAVPQGMMAEAGGQSLGKIVEGAVNSQPVQWAGKKVGSGLTKLAHTFTGIPEEEIKTYASSAPEIKQMVSSSDGDMAEAANQMRQKFTDSIEQTRRGLNDQLSAALKSSDKSIDGAAIVKSLEGAKSSIDPDLNPEQFTQLDNFIEKISKKMGEGGQMSVEDAHKVKQFLQEKASSAYRSPGDIFYPGSGSVRGAKAAAKTSRGLINAIEPQVASANNGLARLHDIEDRINPNLIAPNRPHSALLAAGSGGNPQNAKLLGELGDMTGVDMLADSKKLAAMRTFGNPSIMPVDSTGKAVGRMALGTALGAAGGYAEGGSHGAAVGAGIGGALSSPLAIKTAIDSGLLGKKALDALLEDPTGRNIIGQLLTKGLLNKSAPSGSEKIDGPLIKLAN